MDNAAPTGAPRLTAAQAALNAYRQAKGHDDVSSDLIDLVTDLLHLNDDYGGAYDADDITRIALMHYNEETGQ